jgi:hypothetical protein
MTLLVMRCCKFFCYFQPAGLKHSHQHPVIGTLSIYVRCEVLGEVPRCTQLRRWTISFYSESRAIRFLGNVNAVYQIIRRFKPRRQALNKWVLLIIIKSILMDFNWNTSTLIRVNCSTRQERLAKPVVFSDTKVWFTHLFTVLPSLSYCMLVRTE